MSGSLLLGVSGLSVVAQWYGGKQDLGRACRRIPLRDGAGSAECAPVSFLLLEPFMPHASPSDSAPMVTDPFARFGQWFAEAEASEPVDANAMIVATATRDGKPSSRAVLLKGFDQHGFVFYTNMQSRKAEELADNGGAVALLFYWKSLGRQVRIEGRAHAVSDQEADAYFASRARISRLGAWASYQSGPLDSRTTLERRLAEFEEKYPGDDIPRPPHWSGYRVVPERFEFWQNMPFRLHDRTVYAKNESGGWVIGKLYP
jgi:pyridoxamine 5'-phosphate oxidase